MFQFQAAFITGGRDEPALSKTSLRTGLCNDVALMRLCDTDTDLSQSLFVSSIKEVKLYICKICIQDIELINLFFLLGPSLL